METEKERAKAQTVSLLYRLVADRQEQTSKTDWADNVWEAVGEMSTEDLGTLRQSVKAFAHYIDRETRNRAAGASRTAI